MRKLIESSLVSLDGIVGSPDLLAPHWSEENKNFSREELAECEAFLLGRATYENLGARWSGLRGDPYYDLINAMPKYVASRTLREASWNATVLRGELPAEIATLKQQPGKALIKYGTSALDRTLIEHGLIDEFRFSIFPIALGQGRHIFDGIDIRHLKLQLLGSRTFANGIVRVSYAATYR